jgi:hypothetical protein
MMLAVIVVILIATYVAEQTSGQTRAGGTSRGAAAYILSRGLAKAGGHEPYREHLDNDDAAL